jgi:hypothetical protein
MTWSLDETQVRRVFHHVWLFHGRDQFPSPLLSPPADWNQWIHRALIDGSGDNLLVVDAIMCSPPADELHVLVLTRDGQRRVVAVASDEDELTPHMQPSERIETWSFDRRSGALAGQIHRA